MKKLLQNSEDVDAIFHKLVDKIKEVLPDFGKILVIDGKAIKTHAKPKKIKDKQCKPDRRRDMDGDFGKKEYKGKHKNGTLQEKVVSWFGYKLHLLVDALYELPVAFEVTTASKSEIPQAHKLVDKI